MMNKEFVAICCLVATLLSVTWNLECMSSEGGKKMGELTCEW